METCTHTALSELMHLKAPVHEYGTHSFRRTKATIIYKATGNLRAVQILLGNAKIDSTVRYLGVDVQDPLELAERTEGRVDPISAIHGRSSPAGLMPFVHLNVFPAWPEIFVFCQAGRAATLEMIAAIPALPARAN